MKYLIIILIVLIPIIGYSQITPKPPISVDQTYDVKQYDNTSHAKTLSADMVSLGADRTKAGEIQKYFDGKKEYLTLDEWKEYVRILDISMRDSYTKDFGEITSEKLNWFINKKVK